MAEGGGSAKATATPQAAPARAAQHARPQGRGGSGGFSAALGTTPQALLGLQARAGNRAVSELLGSGRPLEARLRTDMEARFGADFGAVRVHDDRLAHRSAALLEAKAYTQGEHIVFGADRFVPQASQGKHLLAHELAHVVQQRRGGHAPALDAGAAHEHAAAQAADAFLRGDASVVVRGATGIGISRDEDDSFMGRMKRKAQALKESIPPEYREKMQQAADFTADQTVNAVFAPVGGSLVADGLGSTLLHAAQGEPGSGEKLKGFARDKVLEDIGAVKGVVTQVTEVADTTMWFGNEYAELRDKAAASLGGKPGSVGNQIVRSTIDSIAMSNPATGALPALAQANEGAKAMGWVDPSGHASVSEPLSKHMNAAGQWVEAKVGGAPSDPSFFTPMEKGEVKGAIGSQVLLALTGAEEVKVAMAAIGLMGSFRGIVESIRANHSGFYKDPAFWSAIIGAAMTIAGLSKLGAAKRIVQIALKTGALLACVPPLYKLYDDYNDPKLAAGDEQDRHKVLVSDWGAVLRAAADALLAIAHSGGQGKPPPEGKGMTGVVEPDGNSGGQKKSGGLSLDDAGGPKPGASSESTDVEAQKPKKASAKQQKTADRNADIAEQKASDRRADAEASQKKADDAVAKAKKVLENAEAKRNEADTKADKHEKKRTAAESKSDASQAEKDKAANQVARAKKAFDAADDKAGRAEKKVPGADKAAQDAQKRADAAKGRADAAQAKAQSARAKADAMKPTYEQLFGPADPESAPAPNASLPANKEPLVWVRTGQGEVRGTFVPETDARFNKGAGFAIPESQAIPKDQTSPYRPAGSDATATPIEPRRGVDGRQMESRGAGANKGGKFISATAQTPESVNVTSIRPDVAEAHAYNQHLSQGEFGIQRPLGSNAAGVDSITAKIEFDANGRPVRAKIFLNDVTTPTKSKGTKPSHENWRAELNNAVNPSGPDAPQLDFGDPAIDAVIRKAAADGEVYVRIVRVDFTPQGQGAIRMNPAETWRLDPTMPTVIAHPMKPDDKKDKKDDGGAP